MHGASLNIFTRLKALQICGDFMLNRPFSTAKTLLVVLTLIMVWAFAPPVDAGPRRTIRPRHGDTPTGIGGELIHPDSSGPPIWETNTPGGGFVGPS